MTWLRYISDHRGKGLCAHERDWPFRSFNILEVVGEMYGLQRKDSFTSSSDMQG